MENSEKNKELVLFLRNLANSVENNTITSDQSQKLGEFFMSFKMSQEEDKDCDPMDVIKFITMGWYIYSNIIKDSPDIQDID
jgi:hypothetical protein